MVILRGLFVWAYCPIAAEIMIRLFYPVPMLPRYVCATYYGIRGNEPNKVYWHQAPEYGKVQLRINSKGIRDDNEIPYAKPEGIRRIMLLGDSFGMGYEVDLENTFTAQMAHYLETEYQMEKVEVVNLSTSGHGNAEELIALENEGIKYNPDLVILAWHTTDYDDNLRSNLYVLNDGILERRAERYLPGVEMNRKLYSLPFYPLMADNLQLYNMIRDWAGRTVQKWLTAARSISKKRIEPNPGKNNNINEYKVELTMALLEEIRQTAKRGGAEFLILNIPDRSSRTTFQSNFPMPPEEAGRRFYFYCPIHDFEQCKGQKLYWERGHGHFTPLGCKIVGKGLAGTIYEHDLLTEKTDRIHEGK